MRRFNQSVRSIPTTITKLRTRTRTSNPRTSFIFHSHYRPRILNTHSVSICRIFSKDERSNFGGHWNQRRHVHGNLWIKLVRHGESMANTGEVSHLQVGDHNVELSKLGLLQAREVGHKVGLDFIRDSLIFCSPYRRARQTLQELLHTVGLKASDERKIFRVYEDPRLREVEHGYEDIQAQEHMRKTHGWFYYRFQGGESPADCYDRTSIFMESLMRQVERKCKTQKKAKVLIVSHGITIRCFVMRFLHLTVEDFDIMENPGNCDVVTIGPKHALLEGSEDCVFQSGRWAVAGLKLRDQTEWPQKFPYSSFVRLID